MKLLSIEYVPGTEYEACGKSAGNVRTLWKISLSSGGKPCRTAGTVLSGAEESAAGRKGKI